jgi:hypothetical protein
LQTATRVELTANLYLFLAGQTRARTHGCIVLASYAGQRGCEGFQVPPGVTIGYYPMPDPQVDWKAEAAQDNPLQGSLSGRAAFVVQGLMTAANATGQTRLVRYAADQTAANPLLCKYEFADELTYRKENDQIVSVEFYDSLLRSVDNVNEGFDDNLRTEWNYSVVSIRNRIFHGGVTLRDVIDAVRRSAPRVSEFLLPFAAPTVTAASGG